MIDFIDTIAAASAGAVLLVLICTTPEKRGLKLAVASVLGAWIGLAVAVAASGKLADVAILGTLVTLPLVVTAALALASSAVRSALLGIPVPLVIGVNVFRLIGVMFLILASVGRLGGPFPFSAGWGDIITGALAIPVAILAARVPASDPRIIAWNVLGTLDLVVALFLGIVSANGSPPPAIS